MIVAKSIRDPIHGLIDIRRAEMEVIDTPWFQRLRHIRQLSLVNHVYPGAEHTRFTHSLGVMHLAGRAVETICASLGVNRADADRHIALARLAGLVHDIGHPPFSHAGEKELFADKVNHEVMGGRIVLEDLGDTINKQFADDGISAEDVRKVFRGLSPEWRFVTEVLSGPTDVDKMDYLLRDAYFCGARSGEFALDRIMSRLSAEWTEDGKKGSRSIVYLRGALHALEEFLLARYWMFNSVYYHPVVRQLEYVLTRAMKEVLPGGIYPEDLPTYLKWTDDLGFVKMADSNTKWCERLRSRRPFFKMIYSVNPTDDAATARGFADLSKALSERFGDQVIADERRVAVKFYSEDDGGGRGSAVRVQRADGTFAPIRDESPVLRAIPEGGATPYRIFADPAIAQDAQVLAEEVATKTKSTADAQLKGLPK